MDEKHETIRLTIVAILFAIVFGIKQMDLKYDKISTKMSLDVISKSFIDLSMGIFIVYILGVALKYGYKSKLKFNYGFFYDFGVTTTILIVAWTVVLLSAIYVGSMFKDIYAVIIIVYLVSGLVFMISLKFIFKNLAAYFKNFEIFIDEKIKKIKNRIWG